MGRIIGKPSFESFISKQQYILNRCNHDLSFYNRFLNFFTGNSACFNCQTLYKNKLKLIDDFNSILSFVRQQRCLTVEFSINTKDKITIKRNDYKISIETKKDLELQLYSLLHEIGHYKIESRKIKPNIVEAKKFCQQHNLKPTRNTTETIADEICAWKYGEIFAENQSISLNNSYHKFKHESLLTYF